MEQTYERLKGYFTGIPNCLLEVLYQCAFNGTQLRIILVVIRLTYGWRIEKTAISYGDLARALAVDKRSVRRVVAVLLQQRVLFKEKRGVKNILYINKEYTAWSLWITRKFGSEMPLPGGAFTLIKEGNATPLKRGEGTPTLIKDIKIINKLVENKDV